MPSKENEEKVRQASYESVEQICEEYGLEYLEESRDLAKKFPNLEKLNQLKDKYPDLYAYMMVLRCLANAAALDMQCQWNRALIEALGEQDKASGVDLALRHDNGAARFEEVKGSSKSKERAAMLEDIKKIRGNIVPGHKSLVDYSDLMAFRADTWNKKLIQVKRNKPSVFASFLSAVWGGKGGDKSGAKLLSQLEDLKKTGVPPKGSALELLSNVDDQAIWNRQIGIWYPKSGSAKPADGVKKDGRSKADLKESQKMLFYKVIVAARGTYLDIMIRLAGLYIDIDELHLQLPVADIRDIKKALGLPFKGKKAAKQVQASYREESDILFQYDDDKSHPFEWK